MTNKSRLYNNFSKKCFVCGNYIPTIKHKNLATNLPVCEDCKGTADEKKKEQEAIDSLSDGFVCGCI